MKLIYKVLLLLSMFVTGLTQATYSQKKKEYRSCKNYYVPVRRKYREQFTEEIKIWRYGKVIRRTHPREELCCN